MTEVLIPNVVCLVEKNIATHKLKKYSSVPDGKYLFDNTVTHWTPEGYIFTQFSTNQEFEIEFQKPQKINFFEFWLYPKNAEEVLQTYPVGVEIYVLQDNIWRNVLELKEFEDFNIHYGLEQVEILSSSFKINTGLMSIKIKEGYLFTHKVKIKFLNPVKVTEIHISYIEQIDVSVVSINKNREFEEDIGIAKALVTTQMFSKYTDIIKEIKLGNRIFLFSDNNILGHFIITATEFDVETRTLKISLEDETVIFKNRMIFNNMPLMLNKSLKYVLERITSNGNIHFDRVVYNELSGVSYIPEYRKIEEEFKEFVASIGDVVVFRDRFGRLVILSKDKISYRFKEHPMISRLDSHYVDILGFFFPQSNHNLNSFVYSTEGTPLKIAWERLGGLNYPGIPGMSWKGNPVFQNNEVILNAPADAILIKSEEHALPYPFGKISFRYTGSGKIICRAYNKDGLLKISDTEYFVREVNLPSGVNKFCEVRGVVTSVFVWENKSLVGKLKIEIKTSIDGKEIDVYDGGRTFRLEEGSNLSLNVEILPITTLRCWNIYQEDTEHGWVLYELEFPDYEDIKSWFLETNLVKKDRFNFKFYTSTSNDKISWDRFKVVINGIIFSFPKRYLRILMVYWNDEYNSPYYGRISITTSPLNVLFRTIKIVSTIEGETPKPVKEIYLKRIAYKDGLKYYNEQIANSVISVYINNYTLAESKKIIEGGQDKSIKEVVGNIGSFVLEPSGTKFFNVKHSYWADRNTIRCDIKINGILHEWLTPGTYELQGCKVKINAYNIVTTIEISEQENMSKTVDEIKIYGTVLKKVSESVVTKENKELLREFGYIIKEVKNKNITNPYQVMRTIKKLLRRTNTRVILPDTNTLSLDLDLDYDGDVRIIDEINELALKVSLFNINHIIDITRQNYETTIKGKCYMFEDIFIAGSYWGNQDYWGDNPPKYWGGQYYG